jgi:hypothetical protein
MRDRLPVYRSAWRWLPSRALQARYALFFWGALAVVAYCNAAAAREPGVGNNYQRGLTIGLPTGAAPPTGLYLLHRFNYYSSHIVDAKGSRTGDTVGTSAVASQLIIVPGWQFLGASYSAFISQPLVQLRTNIAGVKNTTSGIANTAWSPFNLAWKLGGGWFASVGFSFYGPDGYVTGVNGTNGIGAPFWTFEPSVAVSYLGHGWDLTLHAVYNSNTTNPYDQYRSGDQLFIDLTVTKKIGKFEFGPVGYFARQMTPDRDPNGVYAALAALGTPGIYNAPTALAVGGLLGYELGPVRLQIYATDEIYARDTTQGWKIWGNLTVPLWSPKPPRAGKPRPRS